MTFNDYLKKKKIKLRPWQRLAALPFLKLMQAHAQPNTGKTFLLRVLHDYIENGVINERKNSKSVQPDEKVVCHICGAERQPRHGCKMCGAGTT